MATSFSGQEFSGTLGDLTNNSMPIGSCPARLPEVAYFLPLSFGIGVQWCGRSCHRDIVQYVELLLLQKVFIFHTMGALIFKVNTKGLYNFLRKKLKLDLGNFEPPDHLNVDASDLVSQAVLRKVVVFKKCRKDMVLMKFKLPVEADVIKTGNQFQFRHMST